MGPFQQTGLDAGSGQLRGKLGINDAAAAAAGLGIGLRMRCTRSVDDTDTAEEEFHLSGQ
jgi:hypothetical protein